jgi:hypothetical protein
VRRSGRRTPRARSISIAANWRGFGHPQTLRDASAEAASADLLVDDFSTTGATLAESARLLASVQIRPAAGAVLGSRARGHSICLSLYCITVFTHPRAWDRMNPTSESLRTHHGHRCQRPSTDHLRQLSRPHRGTRSRRSNSSLPGLSASRCTSLTRRTPASRRRARRVELTVVAKGPAIRAEAMASDKYAALDLAWAKLVERLRRAQRSTQGPAFWAPPQRIHSRSVLAKMPDGRSAGSRS